jgi:FkbM family methyltransferase
VRKACCFDVLFGDVRMRLHPLDSSLERVLLLRPQKCYPAELAFLRAALSAGGTLIDAGANVGAMSLPFASMPGVEIIAVEASPAALARLTFNIAANGFSNIRVAPVALSDADGTVRFFSDARDLKLSGIGGTGNAGSEVEVAAKTFATLLHEERVDGPYVLKIDIERHEDRVLLPFFSSEPKSRWPRHVLIETIVREGIPDCVSFMLANGYRKTLETPQNTGLTLEAS